MRDPEWEGVVDGEVCGLGPLADSVQAFLHWVPIKLDKSEALRLCVSCGDALAREVISRVARDASGLDAMLGKLFTTSIFRCHHIVGAMWFPNSVWRLLLVSVRCPLVGFRARIVLYFFASHGTDAQSELLRLDSTYST